MAVLLSQSLHLTEWEPYIMSRATQAQQRGIRVGEGISTSPLSSEAVHESFPFTRLLNAFANCLIRTSGSKFN